MKEKVKNSWRQIYAILKETGYDKLYEDEIKVIVDFIWKYIDKED